MRACLLAFAVACAAPIVPTPPADAVADPTTPTRPGSSPTTPSTPTTPTETAPTTTGTTSTTGYVGTTPSSLPPGLGWVRANRPFISGLCVNVGAPPADEVDRYYDDFHATATHLWETGLPDEIAAWDAAQHPDFRWVSWTSAEGTHPVTGEGVGDFAVTPGRIGYQLWDEPRNLADVDRMQVGGVRIRAEDPDGLVIVNFGNSDGSVSERDLYEYALQTLPIDLIAYDYYSTGHGEYERAALVRELALAYDMPYWRYIDSYSEPGGDQLSAQAMRWAAMLGLVYGYSGHTWFLYETDVTTAGVVYSTLFDGVGSWNHTPNSLFTVVADLNLELEQYARTVNLLTSTDVRYVPETVLYMPDDHQAWSAGAGGDPYLTGVSSVGVGPLETQEWSTGHFVDDAGEVYLMVQNAAREGASFPLYRPEGDLRLTFDFASAPTSVDRTRLQTLDPISGAVVDLPLTWLGGTEAELELTVPAGDVVLLKYATGALFAQMP